MRSASLADHPDVLGPEWEQLGFRQLGWRLLPLRGFLGVTFLYAALQKLANPNFFRASSPSSFAAQTRALEATSPITPLLRLALHASAVVAVLVAVGELAVALGMLAGLWTRLAAFGGMVLSLSFFLTVSWATTPYFYGSDIVFVFAWSVFVMCGAGGVLSLDAWIAAQDNARASRSSRPIDLARRHLLVGARSATLLAVFGGFLGGATALVGRSVGGTRHDAGGALVLDPPGTAPTPEPSSRGSQRHRRKSGSQSERHRAGAGIGSTNRTRTGVHRPGVRSTGLADTPEGVGSCGLLRRVHTCGMHRQLRFGEQGVRLPMSWRPFRRADGSRAQRTTVGAAAPDSSSSRQLRDQGGLIVPPETTTQSSVIRDAITTATGRGPRHDLVVGESGGPAGNARLTAWIGLVLLGLFLVECATLISMSSLLVVHIFLGAFIVPLVLLKTGTTAWRMLRYYLHSPKYVASGPPPLLLRVLAPLVVMGALAVLGTGLALIALGAAAHDLLFTVVGFRVDAITLHQAAFVLWLATTGLHVLGRLIPALQLSRLASLSAPPQHVPGTGARLALIGVTGAAATATGLLVTSLAGWWTG